MSKKVTYHYPLLEHKVIEWNILGFSFRLQYTHAMDMYVMWIYNGIDELNKCIVWVKTDYTDH